MFVHCQTRLIEMYKDRYPGEFAYDGTRAVLFNVNEELPVEKVRDMIHMALTYHRKS